MITRRRRPEQIEVNAMVISIYNGAPYRATIDDQPKTHLSMWKGHRDRIANVESE